MDTAKLRKFAQDARNQLMERVATRLHLVLEDNSEQRRANPTAIQRLTDALAEKGQDILIEQIAYFWFNRLCALRFMDANGYNPMGIITPAHGGVLPEVFTEAESGVIDEDLVPAASIRERISGLLSGTIPSNNPQTDAYRLLLVAACNYWNRSMPFMFQSVNDYTELLMPVDLFSTNSIVTLTREAMDDDSCQDIEVIGWLYQYYIAEKKDAVFAGLKKNQKITPDKIPAATQLFTPHWIVRYLNENSLGRLWMLNHPDSPLIESMDYYIKPEQPETDFLKIDSPEAIKVCAPCVGSGHMLTYAFDLLYKMYEEEGYQATKIPSLILQNNLFGVEIDGRAGELAAFALTMKAREKDRRFFSRNVSPNICVLQNIHFEKEELDEYMDFIGRDLFTHDFQTTLTQFEEADNFGSLIQPALQDTTSIYQLLQAKDLTAQIFLQVTHRKVLQVLKQAKYLSSRYYIAITNPPYVLRSNLNSRIGGYVQKNYPLSKTDLGATFIERLSALVKDQGILSMVTLQSWMFTPIFEKLRNRIINELCLQTMAHIGTRGFASISGDVVATSAFTLKKTTADADGAYVRLVDFTNEEEKRKAFIKLKDYPYFVNSSVFQEISGNTISYWLPSNFFDILPSLKQGDSY